MSGGMTGKNNLRGQMALKSSPLNPSSGKLMSQHLVIDHMTAHYKKLLNAKSAIDVSVPKAYASSQKVRDRETRKSVLSGKSVKRPKSARPQSMQPYDEEPRPAYSRRPTSARYDASMLAFDDDELQGFSKEEIDCINAMVSDTIDSERLERVLNSEHNQRPATARSGTSSKGKTMASRGMMDSMQMNTGLRKKMSADILEKRNHKFTDGDLFTPRTLKTAKYKNIPSKLSQTKHFRPANASANKNQDKNYAASQNDSEMLDETLMSRDFNTRLTMSGTVPKLDISIDQDHMKWLQEQSARHESSRYTPLEKELEMETKYEPYLHKSQTQERIRQEDVNMEYLDFITEVTNDVLTRGIFTNRVLDKVFDEHVQKNKDRLSESRMRGMLDSLREDLGITVDDFRTHDNDDVGMGSVRPAVRSQTKTTGYYGDPKQFKTVKMGGNNSSVAQSPLATDTRTPEHQIEAANPVLADILETSEKSLSVQSKPSVHSSRPSRRGIQESTFTRESNMRHVDLEKTRDTDDLLDILGLDDVGTLENPPTDVAEIKTNGGDATSMKSFSSSHKSKDRAAPSLKDKPRPDELQIDQHSEKSSRWNSSIHKEKSRSGSGRTTPTTLTKQASGDDETVSKEGEREEMESNADFGKTTLFAKTQDMNLTYKALSQVSDEEEEDNYKQDFDDDDDF